MFHLLADASEMVGGLLIAVSCGVVLGIGALLIVYKMIDGEVPFAMGVGALIAVVGVLMLAIKPPHPAVPAVVLVVAITLMAFFPFALNQLDRADLNSFDVDRLARSFESLNSRPDNFASKLEVAKALHSQGMVHHAIAIASATLNSIPTEKDQVSNRSLRDQFKDEDYKVKQWMRTAGTTPLLADHMRCRVCGNQNQLASIVCEKCGNTYLLDNARRGDNRPKVVGKLVLSWGLFALLLVGSATAGLSLKGMTAYATILALVAAIGLLFAWMFPRRPLPG
jgi:hypothetical protein